eukprot:34111-Prymnesium_polylepis.1
MSSKKPAWMFSVSNVLSLSKLLALAAAALWVRSRRLRALRAAAGAKADMDSDDEEESLRLALERLPPGPARSPRAAVDGKLSRGGQATP